MKIRVKPLLATIGILVGGSILMLLAEKINILAWIFLGMLAISGLIIIFKVIYDVFDGIFK